jgi:hypothetical protein
MKFKFTFSVICIFSLLMSAQVAFASTDFSLEALKGGEKEKKEKKEKGEKGDEEANAKMNRRKTYNPKKHARSSAKLAKQSSASKQKQIMYRAGVRNFFHSTFNSKPGKYRNFRNTRSRNRWNKGR